MLIFKNLIKLKSTEELRVPDLRMYQERVRGREMGDEKGGSPGPRARPHLPAGTVCVHASVHGPSASSPGS